MKKIAIILILILNSSCTDVNKLVEEIAKDKIMESKHIGFGGEESSQYQNFQKLKSKASNRKLRYLTNHKNPIIRVYSYQSLIERELIKPSKAFEESMQKNEKFSKMSGCQLSSTDISTEIYFHMLNSYPKLENEIKLIDSLVLFKLDENHFLQYMALNDKEYGKNYNDRIVDLAMNNNSSAIFYIVKNNISVDKLTFKKAIESTIKKGGIGSNPTKELNKILVNLENKN